MASHRRPAQPGLVRVGRVAALSAAAAAAAMTASAPAGAAPREQPGDVASQVQKLYEQAEAATQSYDAAQETETRVRGRLSSLQGEMARGQQAVNRMRDGLAAVAGAQYRDGGIDPTLTLLLSADPGSYLDRAAALDRIQGQRADALRELRDAQRALDQEGRQATAELSRLERARVELAGHKHTVQGKLGQARRLLALLPPGRQAALGFGAGGHLPGLGALAALPDLPPSSARAAEAVAAARAALGLPYAWGSTGPSSFDCSGLMYWSYRHAGITLPRTSQEQLNAGQRVPLDQARPGDLVIYRGDASHVAMYVGGGRVIHAPYPGARVRYDPVDMMPVDGVVRP